MSCFEIQEYLIDYEVYSPLHYLNFLDVALNCLKDSLQSCPEHVIKSATKLKKKLTWQYTSRRPEIFVEVNKYDPGMFEAFSCD